MKADVGFFQEVLSDGKIGNSYTRLQCSALMITGIICVVPAVLGHYEGVATGLALIGGATGMKLLQKPFEAKPTVVDETKPAV